MSRTSKRRRTRTTADKSATTDVVTQLEVAYRRPQATVIGAVVGGLVPWFARTLAHGQLPATWSAGSHGLAMVMLAVVLGCAMFSAITVYKFGCATFGDTRKALGFVLAIEGVMLVSTGATSNVALAVLVVINALANGAAIALARDATCRRRDADARRAATVRARSQAAADRKNTIPVVDETDVPAPAKRATRPARRPAVVVTPAWMDDVIDAEIVSEQKLLS
jgi:hypothetical protein